MKAKASTPIALFLLFLSMSALPVMAAANRTNAQTVQVIGQDSDKNQKHIKYSGYSMDGVTSASKLAAQRSHTVAGQDERNFAIFTGVVVIMIVVFFSQIVFNKK